MDATFDVGAFLFDRFRAMPIELRRTAVDILRAEMPAESLAEVKRLHLTYDDEWFFVDDYHFVVGMAIRNALRTGGIPDADLPEFEGYRNWDDYYIPVLEAAAGVRDVETGEILE